jgi:hypothetical protein
VRAESARARAASAAGKPQQPPQPRRPASMELATNPMQGRRVWQNLDAQAQPAGAAAPVV